MFHGKYADYSPLLDATVQAKHATWVSNIFYSDMSTWAYAPLK